MKNKERVYHAIRTLTGNLNGQISYGLTAQDIAEHVGLQRNVVSHFSNELTLDGHVIKLNTRPVYFIERDCFQRNPEKYPLADAYLKETPMPSIRVGEFTEEAILPTEVDGKGDAALFSQLIGFDGSLKYVVDQCKSAVHYPPHGLPLLLVGNSGVGKSFLAQLISDYGHETGVVEAESPFVVFNCAEYANNAELLSAALFGYCKGAFTGADKDKMGLLEEADGGYLFLDEIHRLSPEGQEKLFLFLDKGVFRKVGETGKWRKANVRMIYATTENPESSFLQTFLRRIPLVVKIPTFQERPLQEKLDLIYLLYQRESKRIGCNMIVSNQVVNLLLKSKIHGNIGKLTNAVKISCASAFNTRETAQHNEIRIRIRHLPTEYMEQYDGVIFDNIGFEDLVISPQSERKRQVADPIVAKRNRVTEQVYNLYSQHKEMMIDFQTFVNQSMVVVNELIDDLMYNEPQRTTPSVIYQSTEKVVESILSMAQMNYGIKRFGNSGEVISLLITHFMEVQGGTPYIITDQMVCMVEALSVILSKEWKLARSLVEAVEKNLDVSVDSIASLYLTLYMKSLNRQSSNEAANAVIVAHGYSTASSIAGVANRMLGQFVFEAFDMPLEMSATEIGHKLNAYLETIDTSKGLVILVDMGSLESLYKGIQTVFYGDIAILNNVSTHLALDVGGRIIEKQSIEQIAKEVLTSTVSRYNFKPAERVRQNAILTTCSTGIGTASKIKDLLERCFENEDIQIVAHDFDKLKGNGKEDYIFKQYQVKLIIGTNDPQIEHVPYVSLENLIMQNGEDILSTALCPLVEAETLNVLSREMIKLFTLENVLNHLTILNPDKIIDQVEKALSHMEHGIGIKLENAHKISLTIHICCMVERLVIKDPIGECARFKDFDKEHPHFVRLVKSAFSVIESFYRVEIPASEVGFIYENIKNRIQDFKM